MKVAITGATGFIGRHLCRALVDRGDEVVALTRSPDRARPVLPPSLEAIQWNPSSLEEEWVQRVAGVDAVVNLAGEPVAGGRWTETRKRKIRASRVDATQAIVQGLHRAKGSAKILVNGSAIGYYGSRGDTTLTEASDPGKDFLAGVVVQWEAEALKASDQDVRVVLIRSGIVLGTDGGALPTFALPFKLFTGGVMGPANQVVSWIHIDDEVGLLMRALDDEGLQGPVNATAPNPVTMDVFSHALGRSLNRPVWVPGLPAIMRLILGAELAASMFASLRVIPERAQQVGYQFHHTDVDEALHSLLL